MRRDPNQNENTILSSKWFYFKNEHPRGDFSSVFMRDTQEETLDDG